MTRNNSMKSRNCSSFFIAIFTNIACLGTCFLSFSCSSTQNTKITGDTLAGDSIVKYSVGSSNYVRTSSIISSWPSGMADGIDKDLITPSVTNIDNRFSTIPAFSVSNEVVDGPAERNRMRKLRNKFHKHPEKKEKYTMLLNREYNKLMQKRETRIHRKLDFLKEMYTCLSNGNLKNFNRICRKHSTNMMLHELKSISKDEENGTPLWFLFCNPGNDFPNKIQICHIKYSDHIVPGLKQFYPIIYGDSTKWNNDKIPYSDADARWYLVTLDKDPIFLRLEGTGKFVLITGIINPAMQLAYCDPFDSIIIWERLYKQYTVTHKSGNLRKK